MKNYLALHVGPASPQWLTADSIPVLKAKIHQIGWIEADCVLCHRIENVYHPIARVNNVFVYPASLIRELAKYMNRYQLAKESLPTNFPTTFKLF